MSRRHLHFVQALDARRGGGMGNAAVGLHRALLGAGEESVVVATRRSGEAATPDPTIRHLVRLPEDRMFIVPRLRTQVEALVMESDVVHAHGMYVDLHRVIGSLAIDHGKTLVYHPHGFLDPWIQQRSQRKKALAMRWFEGRNQRYAQLWRALNPAEYEAIRAYGIEAPAVIAPNGVSVPAPSKWTEPAYSSRRLLYLGRLHPKKGIDLLLQAWADMALDTSGWRLDIVGPDEGGYEQELARLAADLGLTDSVRFHPPVYGEEKEELLSEVSAVVLPSRSEGMPVVLQEAMAVGLPVVATRESNFPGIESRGAGFKVDANPESIAEGLTSLTTCDAPTLRSMGRSGRRWMQIEFTWTAVAERILGALQTSVR